MAVFSLVGIFSALLAAFFWAIATRWFKGLTEYFSFLGLNFAKGIITLVALLLIGLFGQIDIAKLTAMQLILMLLSGVIGIGIGDTLLFAALKQLSEKHTLVIAESIAPVFVILGGMILLGEWLTWMQVVAIGLIIIAVDWVLELREGRKETKAFVIKGSALAIGAALCQAIGILMVRNVYLQLDIDPFYATFLRIIGGLGCIMLLTQGRILQLLPRTKLSVEQGSKLVIGSLIGTLGALVLVQTALLHAPAAVVQTLIATSAIFASLIALVKGERQNRKVWSGIVLAWLGVALMIASSIVA